MKAIDIELGTRKGRLVIVARAGISDAGAVLWKAACDCGRDAIVIGYAFMRGAYVSCGCEKAQRAGDRTRTHGQSKSRTYKSWLMMWDRCRRPGNNRFASYGGRGITVCERWRTFDNFLADMGERPDGTSIDRFPNRDGNYEPGNCRWGTSTEQARNRSDNIASHDLIQEIRGRIEHGESNRSVARRMGLQEAYVSAVVHQRIWADSSPSTRDR